MNIHKNARLTPKGREAMVRDVVDHGLTHAEAARRHHTTSRTVAKWVQRFRALGVDGLQDRSSRPHSMPSQTPLATRDAVEALRRDRYTQEQIALELGLSRPTVSRILKARGLSLLSALEPRELRPRYERETPGEIIHIDIKKLGRFERTGHRITGDRAERAKHRKQGAKAPAGSMFMLPLTIIPASPSARFIQMRKNRVLWPISKRRWIIINASVSPSHGS